MQVRIKLMGFLKEKTPVDGALALSEHATIADVLTQLEIPPTNVQVLTVNGSIERNRDRVLQAGDALSVLPPVGGG
jgi:sulfur carrier protein ThiS